MKQIDKRDADEVSGGYPVAVPLPPTAPCFPQFPDYPQNPSGPLTSPEPVYNDPVK